MNTDNSEEARREDGSAPVRAVEELIQLATRRLRPDAELQMEVAHELRAHLEDAVASARADGASEAQAQQQALEQFGDPNELSDKLWQANRRRMRWRAVARWGFRAAALPAAVVLACVLNWQGLGFVQYLSISSSNPIFRYAERLHRIQVPYREDLSGDEKAVLDVISRPASYREAADELAARFPDSPLFQANRVSEFLNDLHYGKEPLAPELVDKGLEAMNDGERVEPDNAFYNYMKAALLMRLSGASDTELDPAWRAETPGPYASKMMTGPLTTVRDSTLFERGLAEYRNGLAKPRYCSYESEMAALKASLRRTPAHVEEVMQGVAIVAGTRFPDLSLMRDLNSTVLGYANTLSREGRRDEATALLAEAPLPATQLGLGSRALMGLLLARHIRWQSLRLGAALCEQIGATEQAANAKAASDAEETPGGNLIHRRYSFADFDASRRAGILMNLTPPTSLSVKDAEARFTPIRNAERSGLERAAMGLAAGLLTLILLWNFTLTGIALVRHRRNAAGPRMLFIGWRRLCSVVLMATLLPLLAYYLFSRSPLGSAQYGINWAWDRMALEMGITAAAILLLALLLGRAAVKARCREAAIIPAKRRFAPWRIVASSVLAAIWAIVVVVAFGVRPPSGDAWREFVHAVSLTAPFAVVAGLLLVQRSTPELRSYAATERRSMAPVWVGCLMMLGLVALGPLQHAERRQTERMYRSVMSLWNDEVSSTVAVEYQSYLQSLPERGKL